MNFLTREGFRIDGRNIEDIRQIDISHEIINNIIHVHYAQGETKVSCFIDQYNQRNTREDFKTNIIFEKTAMHEQENMSRKCDEMGEIIKNTFEAVVRCGYGFTINIRVLQDEGSLLSVIVNAVSLTLSMSNVQMLDLCISIEMLKVKDKIFCDVGRHENTKKKMLMCYFVNRKTIGYFYFSGKMKQTEIITLYETGVKCCDLIYAQISKYLKQ